MIFVTFSQDKLTNCSKGQINYEQVNSVKYIDIKTFIWQANDFGQKTDDVSRSVNYSSNRTI